MVLLTSIFSRISQVDPKSLSYDRYLNKVEGGWLGKCIGGALGMPVEGWHKDRIAQKFGTINDYIGYFDDWWKSWSGVLAVAKIPKDENWHQLNLEVVMPQFETAKLYARLIIGMTLEHTREESVFEISDIAITINGKPAKLTFNPQNWDAMEGCHWLQDGSAHFQYNGERSWLRLSKPIARKLGLKPGMRVGLKLRTRWLKGNNEIALAFDFNSLEKGRGFGPDDDTAYQIVDLHALQTYGLAVTAQQLGKEWVDHLPFACTAEAVALENLRKGLMPPQSAQVDNPYSEWIGGQIKADIWGLIAPGLPTVAARYGHEDGIIAHTGEGIYGEMFTAAVVSMAFFEPHIQKLLKIGLTQIPPDCLYAQVIKDIISWHKQIKDWQAAWDKLNQKYGKHYHPVHVLPNAGVVALALLYGNKDFGKSICLAVMCGWDTDCNGATVGCILGTMLGAKAIPAKWAEPINNQFRSYVKGFENWKISELSKQIAQIGEKVIIRNGGKVETQKGKKVLRLP